MRFSISPGAVLLISAVYFAAGAKAVLAIIISVCVHELGHAAAIKLFGGRVISVRFDSSGLCITGAGVEPGVKELVVLLCGPMLGLAFAAVCARYPENEFAALLAITGFVLTAYNLLPAYPLDGGRMVYAMLREHLNGKMCENIMYCLGLLAGTALAACRLASMTKNYGAALLVAGIWLLIAQTGIVKSMRLL